MYWNSKELFDKLSACRPTHQIRGSFTLTLRWILGSKTHWDSEVLLGESREV